jgi:hypothetical protein
MAFGRHGLSVEEVNDYFLCRRAQLKGVLRGWQMKYGGKLCEQL